MLTLLRKVRRKLFPKNKVTGYLLYAIGEIVLVVIGILIALQINNWNEKQRTNKQINESLKALRSDLVQDTLLIFESLPEIKYQFKLNESLRSRVAHVNATKDTLLSIARTEFNPNWTEPLVYNSNAYNSLIKTSLIELLSDSLKNQIKNFYNQKDYKKNLVIRITEDYRGKLASYVDTYTFGSTSLHDQGQLIDALVWKEVDYAHLAASFQGLSNFKRILFSLTREEMEYSHENAKLLIRQIDRYLTKE